MIWDVEIGASARKQIAKLPDAAKREVREVIRALHEYPVEFADTVLEGHDNLYAVRFYRGRYRLVYQVSEKRHLVIVLRARPRANAYEGLEPYWF